MPIEFSVSIAYDDIYDDYATVNVKELLADIPSKMALTLVCHYTAQVHTEEKNPNFQFKAIADWSQRFQSQTIQKLQIVIDRFTKKGVSNFNFINNVSSLYLTECLLEIHNDLPVSKNLTPLQEENLFKAYLYYSAKWTKEQEAGAFKYRDVSVAYMGLVMLLPYSELFEFKDFRLQFLKAIYFFKFCQDNELFGRYLETFLAVRGLKSWNQYLYNLVTVYVTLLQKDNVKSVLDFTKDSMDVYNSLEHFCIDANGFKPVKDFLFLRSNPIYKQEDTELLFLNINFLIDKVYQGIMFDFSDILIKNGVEYNGKPIKNRQQFFGIFGDEFIEVGLFFKVMHHVFRQKDYAHFTGDELKNKFGDGAPDYLIIDNRKIYVFEFKNTFFSGPIKYTFDIDQIKNELNKKFVQNEDGKPKGVTQLINFAEDLVKGRYNEIIKDGATSYIIYPILVTTDFTFNLPVIYSLILERYNDILKVSKILPQDLQIRPITLIDFDLLIKFQDIFISKKLTLNHVLNNYQTFLNRGVNPIDKSLSFHKYLHVKTASMKYDSPKMFMEEIKSSLF